MLFQTITDYILGKIYFDTTKTNPKMILNRYCYKINVKLSDRTYWKCIYYGKTNCKAHVTTRGKIARVNMEEHNHYPTHYNCTGLYGYDVYIIRK